MLEKETVREVYKHANHKQRYLIEATESEDRLYGLAEEYHMNKESTVLFIQTVSHIILGFYKIEDTVPLLQQELSLDPKTAAHLGAEVLEFLAPLSDPNWQPPAEVEEDGPSIAQVQPEPIPEYRIPVKAPALDSVTLAPISAAGVGEHMLTPESTKAMTPTSSPNSHSQVHNPATSAEPLYRPAPLPSNPPSPRPSLESIPSYAPTPSPVAQTSAPAAPDRPRWSTDI
jgi:hypothetical protein